MNIGYDTVSLSVDYLTENFDALTGINRIERDTGYKGLSGYLKGIKVNVHSSLGKTTLRGSLGTWANENNFTLAGPDQVKQFLNEASDLLGIDLEQAKTTRIDFAQNIFTDYPANDYFSSLAWFPKKNRHTDENTLYFGYRSKTETLCFYNKKQEMKAKRKAMPDQYQGVNVLRYEMRLKSRPDITMKQSISGATLTDKTFFEKLSERHREQFNRIRKINPIQLDPAIIKNSTDLYRHFAAYAIQLIGPEESLSLFQRPAYKESRNEQNNRNRLRKTVRDLLQFNPALEPSSMTDELSEKINIPL